jgi:hypothetical protein
MNPGQQVRRFLIFPDVEAVSVHAVLAIEYARTRLAMAF